MGSDACVICFSQMTLFSYPNRDKFKSDIDCKEEVPGINLWYKDREGLRKPFDKNDRQI
jgi:hypothetical protein